ncbi:MAG: hypothetical protein JWO86_5043 [Myxococcaceae bacterium]|nr:hypothetical protein [Myxococcaceae bacterium]
MGTDTSAATPLVRALEELAPHDHLCSIYETSEERLAVEIPFLRIGLERGEKCISIVDDGTEGTLHDALHAGGIDVDRAIATSTLEIVTKGGSYLKSGSFDRDWMFTFWADATAKAQRDGFKGLRATGDTDWMARDGDAQEHWLDYESRLTQMLAGVDCRLLCQYPRKHFSAALLLDVIRTHPTVIHRGVVCRNMYYVPPDDLLGHGDRAARRVEHELVYMRERERVEQTLRESEERWRSVFENSAIGMVLGDAAANLLSSNKAFQDLIGYDGDELRGLTVWDLTDDSDLERNVELRTEVVEGKRREMQMVKRLRRKDGRRIWARVTSSRIPGKPGGPPCIVALVEDVTDRRRAEDALDEQREQLVALSHRLIEVQEAERRAVARELHDDFGQVLTALRLSLQKPIADPAEGIALVDEAIGRMRDLALDLRPPIIDDLGLAPALRWYVAREAQRAGLEYRLEIVDLDDRLAPLLEITCFRLVQEGLTNITRHAAAKTVTVALTTAETSVAIEISDDGIGFDLIEARHRATAGGNQGLIGLQERVSLAGGHLMIDAAPGRGTTIRARFPRLPRDSGAAP